MYENYRDKYATSSYSAIYELSNKFNLGHVILLNKGDYYIIF